MTYSTKKLGEVCEINPVKSEIKDFADDTTVSFVPMSAVSEVTQGVEDQEDRRLSEVKKGYTYFRKGDILFAKITPCMENGKVALANNIKNEIGFASTEFHVIRASEKILPEYVFHLVASKKFRDEAQTKMTGSAGQKRVPKSFLENYEIPLPSIVEQRKIVAKLEKVLGKIKEAKKLREEAESAAAALLPAELHKIFSEGKKKGWEEKELGDIVDFFNGKAHEPFINSDGRFKVINSKFISKAGIIYKTTNNQLSPLLKNDIVMVMSDVPNGKALAKCYLVEKDNVYTLNQRIGCFRVKNTNEIYPQYLLTRLNRNEQLLAHDKGRGQTNLRKNDILNIKIPLPPIAEQKKIVARLDALSAKVQNLRQAQTQTASDFTALEQSVLHQAFNIK